MVAAAVYCGKGDFRSKEPFEAMPDVMDAKQLAEALQISKAGAYNLLNSPDFPTLRIGGRKLVMKNELVAWPKSHTNRKACKTGKEPEKFVKSRRFYENRTYQERKDHRHLF